MKTPVVAAILLVLTPILAFADWMSEQSAAFYQAEQIRKELGLPSRLETSRFTKQEAAFVAGLRQLNHTDPNRVEQIKQLIVKYPTAFDNPQVQELVWLFLNGKLR